MCVTLAHMAGTSKSKGTTGRKKSATATKHVRKSSARQVGSTKQRSFRMTKSTLDRLDQLARIRAISVNSLAEQLLFEGLRTTDHPLIHFRQGGDGRRRPALLGTRLYVWQVMATVQEEGSIEGAAQYLELSPAAVQACVSYYAAFRDEVDADAEDEREAARREEERLRKEHEVVG